MSAETYKKARATTREARAAAERRAEVEHLRELIGGGLRSAREAGRQVMGAEVGDSMTRKALRSEGKELRAQAQLLDQEIRWRDPLLFEFLNEPPLAAHETPAERAAKIVKRVNARLKAAEVNGFPRAWLLRGAACPKAAGWTTFGFANRWARRDCFDTPRR